MGESTAVFDPASVQGLTGDVSDPDFVRSFVSSWRRLLPERVRRTCAALQGDDAVATRDAVLSLATSSVTVGATELAALGLRIDGHLREGDRPAAQEVARHLAAAADRADRALAAYFDSELV